MSLHQYICRLTMARPNMHLTVTPDESAVLSNHGTYLEKLYSDKVIHQAGTSFEVGEEHFAVVIFSAENKLKATELMSKDPAVAQGLLHAKITEYKVFLDRGLHS